MTRPPICASILMAAGAAMAGWGLFAKLLGVPVLGEIRYVDLHLGGKELAVAIIILMVLAAVFSPLPGRGRPCSMLCAGAALGLVVASFLGIYRNTLDQMEQLGDPHAYEILSQAKRLPGLWVLGIGLLLSILGVIFTLLDSRDGRNRRS